MRKFLLGNEEVPLKSYAKDDERKNQFLRQFRADGFDSALQMYRATATNVQAVPDSELVQGDLSVGVPILFFSCTEDAVCVSDMMAPAKQQGLVPKLQEVVLECGHWSPMEKPDEIAAHIKGFVSSISHSN